MNKNKPHINTNAYSLSPPHHAIGAELPQSVSGAPGDIKEAYEVIKGAATQRLARLGPGEGRRPHVNIGRSEHACYILYRTHEAILNYGKKLAQVDKGSGK